MGREAQIQLDRHHRQFKAGLVTYFILSTVPQNVVQANVSTSKQHSGSECFSGFWIISNLTMKARFFIPSGVFHNLFVYSLLGIRMDLKIE